MGGYKMDRNNYEQLRKEDMMEAKANIYREPLKREDMMQPYVDMNNEFSYEEEQTVHRKR